MKNIWKRLAGMLVTACMVMAMVPAPEVSAATATFNDNDINYEVLTEADGAKAGTVKVTAKSGNQKYTGDITIPKTAKYDSKAYTVTEIGKEAFYECASLGNADLSEATELTTIGERAFKGCTALTNVSFPESLTTIGTAAFADCTALTNVSFPESLTTIDSAAFQGCTALTSVPFPAGLTTISSYAFKGCTALTNVALPAGLTEIYDSVFWGCTKLANVTFPAGLTAIYANAFWGCTKLANVTFPASLTTISQYAFWGCTALTNVTFPKSLTTIDNAAFSGCTALTSLTFLGENPPTFGWGAFRDVANIAPYSLTVFVPEGHESAFRTKLSRKLFREAANEKSLALMFVELKKPDPAPLTPSTPYIPPITVKGDFGVELILKESQLPEGVKAEELRLPVTMPAPDAITATLASHPELPAAKGINLFDIALTDANGDAVTFTGKATVRVPLDEMGGFLRAFFHDGSGTLSELNASINGIYVEFQVEHFSHYAVVDFASPAGKLPTKLTASAAVTTAATTAKPSEDNNAESNPKTGMAMLPIGALLIASSGVLQKLPERCRCKSAVHHQFRR